MNKLFYSNLLSGTLLFNRFMLKRCLSAGEMGGVYLCDDTATQQQLVIKILSTNPSLDPTIAKRFYDEIELSCLVKHPNVVSSREFFRDDEFIAFTMDYFEGGTLADIIASGQELDAAQIFNILKQLSRGLEAIHRAGIIHRDVKPENILIDSFGTVKITDFGIAATAAFPDQSNREGLQGSIDYLSPEYIEIGIYDQRADIYSFGVVGYELLTRQKPFEATSLLDTLLMKVLSDPISPNYISANIQPELGEIVMKAMARDLTTRFQSIEDVVALFELLESSNSENAEPASGQWTQHNYQDCPQEVKSVILIRNVA